MTIRLRAHHLLCLLTWAGKGYSPAFTAGFTAIAGRIAAGEAVVLVEGPDDVCVPMLADPGCHCRGGSVARRDAQAARDLAADATRISRQNGGKANYSVRSGIRPGGRAYVDVVSDNEAEERGSEQVPRINALRRAARGR